MALTTKQLQALKPGHWVSDGGARGAGKLLFRRTNSGERLAYFRYTLPNGKRDTLTLGNYDEQGISGLSLTEARTKAGELSKLYQGGIKDLRDHIDSLEDAEKAAKTAEADAIASAARATADRQRFTLWALCEEYCNLLESQGKPSARQARSLLKCHVLEACPDFSSQPANEVSAHQITSIIRKVTAKGKPRAAGVLRSYLLAAYNLAYKAPFDAVLPTSLIHYNVTSNPVQPVLTIAVRRGNRILTENELRLYISKLGSSVGELALKLALYSGGQRIAQILRAKVRDYDPRTQTLRLSDNKGRRITPREHLVPLGKKGADIVSLLIEKSQKIEKETAEYERRQPDFENCPLFLSAANTILAETTPGKHVSAICSEIPGEAFNLRDLRRTCETILASLGVNKDVRAQLLSHGLSGVQDAHYDRYSYIDEKRAALNTWEGFLNKLTSQKPTKTKCQ